jgi:hypothetical protein
MIEEIIYRDDVTVELVKASASDADVIWAARVSTAGEQSMEEIGEDLYSVNSCATASLHTMKKAVATAN